MARAGRAGSPNEGKENVSAEPAAPEANARVPGSHEHEERAIGPEAPARQRAQAADRQQRVAPLPRFRRSERVRRRADFQQVYERGARIRGRYSTIFVMRNKGGPGRLGIAATRKLGGAVVRNRAKR